MRQHECLGGAGRAGGPGQHGRFVIRRYREVFGSLVRQSLPGRCARPGAPVFVDTNRGDIAGAQDGAARVEVTRRREDQPGAAGVQCRFELFRVCQIIDWHQHPARRQDAQSCGDPDRRVWRPECDCGPSADPVFAQAASQAQRLLGESLAAPCHDAVFAERDDGWVLSPRRERRSVNPRWSRGRSRDLPPAISIPTDRRVQNIALIQVNAVAADADSLPGRSSRRDG